ncbi:MAG: CTP synthase, partial [Deltaproteobacteria bacterium]|nr:CTP synthase [Deltaproteobacteria bacterium]
IGIVGKYVHFTDSYKSLNESLRHGGLTNDVFVKLTFIEAETLEQDEKLEALHNLDGILVPGGFGERGIEGKIRAIRYAREQQIPFYGICLGMQLAVIEFARNVCGWEKANSLEFDPNTPDPVINLMEEQKAVHNKGATMRLGSYPCTLEKGTKAFAAYGERQIEERHRHRYEFNNQYRDRLCQHGLVVAGVCEPTGLVEMIELPQHPWFVGCQFHPEFNSQPLHPHPLFAHFIQASRAYAKRRAWAEQKTPTGKTVHAEETRKVRKSRS